MTTPITIQLSTPISFEGYTITELNIRRPKVRDLRVMEQATADKPTQLDQGAAMVALLSGIPEAAIEELDAADFTRASEVIAGFFEKATPPGTGGA